MKTLLILIATHISNPSDTPGTVIIPFPSYEECIVAKESFSYELKFKTFTIKAECIKES